MQTLPASVQSLRVIQLVHTPSHPYLSTSSLCTSPFMMSDTQAMVQWVTRLSQHLNSESQHRGHNLIAFALEAAGVAHCVDTPNLLEALPKVLPRVTLESHQCIAQGLITHNYFATTSIASHAAIGLSQQSSSPICLLTRDAADVLPTIVSAIANLFFD